MAFPAPEHAVLVDTEVFAAVRLDFDNPNLTHLAVLSRSGRVKLLITSVILDEIKSKIVEQVEEIAKQMRQAADQPLLRVFDQSITSMVMHEKWIGDLTNVGVKRLENYLTAAQIEVLQVDGVSNGEVMADYFAKRPPFGSNKKKSEFPDAFTLHALRNWAKDQKLPVTLISGDNDLKRFCESNQSIAYEASLAAFLAIFPDPVISKRVVDWLDDRWQEVEPWIIKQFEKLDFYLDGADGKIATVTVEEAIPMEYAVVEIETGVARVSVDVELTANATAELRMKSAAYPRGINIPVADKLKEYFQLSLDVAVELDGNNTPAAIKDIAIVARPSMPSFTWEHDDS